MQVLTALVLAITHKCLLHRFGCLNSVFLFNGDGMCRCDDSLCDNFQRFNDTYVAEFLCNIQSSLSIL